MRERRGRRPVGGSDGFTLVEVMVAMVLALLVGTTALVGLRSYAEVQDRQGTADAVVSVLRTTAQRSLSEGRTYCVAFDEAAGTWSVWRRSCTTGTRVETGGEVRGDTRLDAVSFATPAAAPGCPTAGSCTYFFPRGTASPGSMTVAWGTTGSINITVEGLSSRVARS